MDTSKHIKNMFSSNGLKIMYLTTAMSCVLLKKSGIQWKEYGKDCKEYGKDTTYRIDKMRQMVIPGENRA